MREGDYIVRATAGGGMIRAFAATAKNTVETARKLHNTSPVATVALGRLLTAALLCGADMKDERDLLTIKIECNGPIGGLLATANNRGDVKGYVRNPAVMLPCDPEGGLNVGDALDLGVLSVIKDIGLKEPYVGQTILVSGEIAEDLAYYFAVSEQVPSTVALGVLMNRDNTVRQSGGFIIQLMPGASEEIVSGLEESLKGMKGITRLLDENLSPEEILTSILGDFDPAINDVIPARFKCDCSREKVSRALYSLSPEELKSLCEKGEDVEMVCGFCGKKYVFTPDEIETLRGAALRQGETAV